nr:IclR family transcriptional regulator [Enterovirga sp. DB1703]
MEPADETVTTRGAEGSSLTRVLGLLELYTVDRPAWTAEEIAHSCGYSKATSYRYLRALAHAGLIAPDEGGRYVLGPRIIQLDRQIRMSDPLLVSARPVMASMRDRLGVNLILCSIYADRVICIHEEWQSSAVETQFSRGRPMPLFRGAASKIILANLPPSQIKSAMLNCPDEIRAAGLGRTWAEFRGRLREIRRAGFCIADSEVDAGLEGTAVPIFRPSGSVMGCLCMIRTYAERGGRSAQSFIAALQSGAREIEQRLATSAVPRATDQARRRRSRARPAADKE